MKSLLFLLLLAFPASAAYADDDSSGSSDSIASVFVREMGRSGVNVLQLKTSGAYDYSRYTTTRVYHDFGEYNIRHGKITFESHAKKRQAAYIGGKTYFINNKGLFKTRQDALFGKGSVLDASDEADYRNAWTHNPLTGKLMDPATGKEKVEAIARPMTTAQRNAMLSSYTKNYYLGLAGNYSLLYRGVIERSYCGPDCYSSTLDNGSHPWNYDTSSAVLFSNFETVMHETVHSYNNTFNTGGTEGCLVEPGIEITYARGYTFPSSEFGRFAPADASEKIFRFKTYVSDSAVVSANTTGMYGLMDEFSAYHNGVRACVMAAQNALQKGDTARAAGFVAQASGTYFAYYEFNLFMAWYLRAAKSDHPDIYQELMANNNLRVAYTLLDADFKESVDNLKSLNDIVKAQSGKDYLAVNEKLYAAYPKQLLAKEKTWLDKFRVKGVNKSNYVTYLK